MRKATILLLAFLGSAACDKERDGAASGSTAGSTPSAGSAAPGAAAGTPPSAAEGASDSGQPAAMTPPPAAVTPPPAAGSAAPAAAAKTCADGDAAACVAEALAIAPTGGYRAELSPAEADAKEAATVELAARACELDSGEGCALVAHYGKYAESDKNLERACELGHVPSCGSIGRELVDKGKAKDRARAAELLEKACAADAVDWMSQTSHHGGFCQFLREVHGRLGDEAKAAKALERACAQGDKRGCPCKTDGDCGEVPEDMSGDYFCGTEGTCDMSGG